MGRLPDFFAAKRVTFRIPFIMAAEQVVDSDTQGFQFPEAALLHNTDKPFEIHRMIVKLTLINGATGAVVPYPTMVDDYSVVGTSATTIAGATEFDMQRLVRLRVRDTSKNELITKNLTRVDQLFKANEQSWEWEEPYTLVRSEQLEIGVDTDDLSVIGNLITDPATGAVTLTDPRVRVEVSFEGFLLVIAPATETR